MIKMTYSKRDFKVGQRVRVRRWDDMEREFGCTSEGNINCNYIFIHDMNYLCGQEFTIEAIRGDDTVIFVENDDYHYSLDMIEPLHARNHHCAVETASLFE